MGIRSGVFFNPSSLLCPALHCFAVLELLGRLCVLSSGMRGGEDLQVVEQEVQGRAGHRRVASIYGIRPREATASEQHVRCSIMRSTRCCGSLDRDKLIPVPVCQPAFRCNNSWLNTTSDGPVTLQSTQNGQQGQDTTETQNAVGGRERAEQGCRAVCLPCPTPICIYRCT